MPKPKGEPHPHNALSALKVKALKTKGRYSDGADLSLVVSANRNQRWLLRVAVYGQTRDIALGGTRDVSLAEALEKAIEYRKIAQNRGDPRVKVKAFDQFQRGCRNRS
jgi:uncharacterized protein (DUF58 family)